MEKIEGYLCSLDKRFLRIKGLPVEAFPLMRKKRLSRLHPQIIERQN